MKFGTTLNPTLSNSSNVTDGRSEQSYHTAQLQYLENTGSLSLSNSEDSQDKGKTLFRKVDMCQHSDYIFILL